MDLPQQIYEDYKEDIKGVLIFMDEFQILKDLDEDVNVFYGILEVLYNPKKI